MIIELLLDAMYAIFSVLIAGINIATVPVEFVEVLVQGLRYLSVGFTILGNYANLAYLGTLWVIVVAVDSAVVIYSVVMWVMRKIPMANVS